MPFLLRSGFGETAPDPAVRSSAAMSLSLAARAVPMALRSRSSAASPRGKGLIQCCLSRRGVPSRSCRDPMHRLLANRTRAAAGQLLAQ